MKIAQLFENDIEEARRNNWGREQSHATGQQYGRELPQALPAADQQAAIKTGQAQAAQGQAQADLQARLAQRKAQKAAATAAAPAQEPAQTAPAAQQQAAPAQQTGQTPAAKPGLTQRVTGALRKAGDVGAAVTGAVGNVGAGFFGGMKRGYSQQASGGAPVSWSSQGSAPAGQSPAFTTNQTSGGAGGDRDVAALSARVDALEKALQQRGAVAEDFKFHSNFLGRDI